MCFLGLNQTITAPRFERQRANPKNVAAIILGGGAGAQLFPLTSRAATPAVRKMAHFHFLGLKCLIKC